ncbi:MAG: DNA helicase RecQ [Ignavibacteriaceae bacterium]|nr:DNA helicase RecQ [Ignavibacteriaceae bacterium]
MDRAQQILKDIFGYDSFRPLQMEVIQNVLHKKDTLVVMPTGGGKSICYQIPALIFEGLTIVVSPLISLMKDQVEQLRQLGVNTALLNSSLSAEVYRNNFESVKNKKAKLLYVAPESLLKDDIINLLKSITVDCITVDEAHCISEWGHDFRKEYRQLGRFRKIFPSAACMGLTATATPRVQDDIVKNLNMSEPKRFLASFNRENLFLQVVPKQEPFQQTVEFLKDHPNQSGIIYCFSRKQVDNLHEDLSDLGYSTKPYHAGLSDEERSRNQDLFIKDEVQIIIATIAFGMGINKSNVRFVIHYDLPKNIESYYQEIGRSGRDGLRSDCLLLFSYADIAKINYFIDQKEDDVERMSAKAHLAAMVKYAESEICRRHPLINYFGEPYDTFDCGMCDNCLAEEKELIDITVPAQKILSTVKRTGEVFGMNYLIDVLTGNDTDRILSNGHQNLTVFGIGKEYTKKQWQNLANQLVRKELLIRNLEFGSIKLTERASGVLFKNQKVLGTIKEPEIASKKSKRAEQQAYDAELFELLRRRRKELAEDQGIPPYIIFSDKALAQMASDYPQSEDDLLKISGVGINKLERYGNTFLSIIKKYCARKNITGGFNKNQNMITGRRRSRNNSSQILKHIIVGESYNYGASIKELAEEHGIKTQTIVTHIARYAGEGHEVRIDGLMEQLSLPEKEHIKVFHAFKEEGILTIKTIFDKFNGEISYEDLHILKIIYLNKLQYNM